MSTPRNPVQPGNDEAELLAQLAARYHVFGAWQEAEKCWQQALALTPTQGSWWLELARLQREHTPQQARTSYAQAIAHGCQHARIEAMPLNPDIELPFRPAPEVWTGNRLDIAVKLLYALDFLGNRQDDAWCVRSLYREHIQQRTSGREPGSLSKLSVEDYERSFQQLIRQMQVRGFDTNAAIPMSATGRILNGAHRLAAALALGIPEVPTFVVENEPVYDWDMRWFIHHGFQPPALNAMLTCWLQTKQHKAAAWLLLEMPPRQPASLTTIMQSSMMAWRELWLPDGNALSDAGFTSKQDNEGLTLRYFLLEGKEADRTSLLNILQQVGENAMLSNSDDQAALLTSRLLNEREVDRLRGETSTSGKGVAWASKNQPLAGLNAVLSATAAKWENLSLLEGVNTVIDVGVAYGTPALYRHFPKAHIVLIEPVPYFRSPIAALRNTLTSSDYIEVGLASAPATAKINYRHDAPILTSLLESSALRDNGREEIEQLTIQLTTLDLLLPTLPDLASDVLLKIDSEGYELEILKGGIDVLPAIKYLMLEVSVIQRFEASYSCTELMQFLHQQGFVLFTCLSASVDSEGYCRVIDAVFINGRYLGSSAGA
ncbi:FkbM family methyltransferase [Methylovorus glucosotrophus]|uniref:Methyltransferase FkbM family n=1 Tax=Methylovorus glucosotrophus (strain SIP3-4) TaxID=582744 RepID=C6XBR0_METGS|nr:FkbM family methyltransferase [Methylovorus glucosotrophus]ACT52030.1 methyltransferase FkbM family [Methylovorus glucosotrophus SIP3-4]